MQTLLVESWKRADKKWYWIGNPKKEKHGPKSKFVDDEEDDTDYNGWLIWFLLFFLYFILKNIWKLSVIVIYVFLHDK